MTTPGRSSTRCCADCSPDCEVIGLGVGQVVGAGDSWLGQPFDDDGANADAVAFWGGVGCCDRCDRCPVCHP